MDRIPDDARIQALSLQAGDKVVITFPGPITDDQARWLVKHARDAFPDNQILILGDGAEVAVVRPGRRGP